MSREKLSWRPSRQLCVKPWAALSAPGKRNKSSVQCSILCLYDSCFIKGEKLSRRGSYPHLGGRNFHVIFQSHLPLQDGHNRCICKWQPVNYQTIYLIEILPIFPR